MNSKRSHLGYTAVEVIAILAVLGLIAMLSLPRLQEEWTERIVNHAAERVNDVFTAARRYRLDTRTWPSSPAELVTAGYLTSAGAQAPLGGSYTFSVVAGDMFEIRFNAGEGRYANLLLGRLPHARRIGAVDVASQVNIPGYEPAFDGLDEKYYHRDGSRELTGPLAGGNQHATDLDEIHANILISRQDITKFIDPADLSVIHNLEANNISANTVTANRVNTDILKMTQVRRNNDPCSAAVGDIGITSSGDIVMCKSGRWTKPGVYKNYGPHNLLTNDLMDSTGNRYGTWTAPPGNVRNASAYVLRSLCSSQGRTWTIRAYANNREIFMTWYHDSGRGGGNDSIYILENNNNGTISTRWSNGCTDAGLIQLIGYFT